MLFHLVVASEYLAALCCSQPRFLILSCSAYLASVQSEVCNERHAYTSPQCVRTGLLCHASVHTYKSWRCVCNVPLAHKHTQTPVYLTPHVPNTCVYKAAAGWCGQMWDPSPVGNDRFRGCFGWRWTEAGLRRIRMTRCMQWWRGVMTSSV